MDAKAQRSLLTSIDQAQRDLRAGRRVEAVLVYEDGAKRKDLNAITHAALGRLSLALDGRFQAVQHFQSAVDEVPDSAEYLEYLGIALQAENRSQEASEVFERALEIDDSLADALNGLGIIFTNRGDYEKAVELLRKAERAKPGDGAIQTNLAKALSLNNEYEEALKHATKGLKLAPDRINSHYTYGTILSQSGRVEDAVKHFETTIRKHPMFGGAYDHLARIKKFSTADGAFIAKAEKILKKSMPAKDRLCLHFALGKIHDDCQQYDQAFEHYRQANLLKRKPFDIRIATRLFDQVRKTLNSKSLQSLQAMGSDSDMPIFILGMPRSGTTLMERMITSSEHVAGAGELVEIPHIAAEVAPPEKPRQFAALLKQKLTGEGIHNYAQQYLRVLRQADQTATRIVDKLPTNYMHVWLISILFPRASIIFARRHPLDVALSCYFQNFATVAWADDFKTIAEAYRLHRRVMEHWSDLLPEGKIIEVEYERLVEEPDTYGRNMLEGCGLEWSGDGLEHYKKEKVVKTASLWQVRQPVYQSSRKRWKNYAPHLGELAEQLSDFLQDDREELAQHGINISAPSGLRRLKRLFG